MVQKVVPSNEHSLGHLIIGNEGVIRASDDQQNEL